MCCPVQQWPTAHVTGDVAGFADSSLGSLGIVQARKELSVVEQAVGEVVGGAQLAQAADRVGEGLGGDLGVGGGGQPGTDEVAFGPLHRRQVPRLAGVDQRKQLTGSGGITQLVGSAGGQAQRRCSLPIPRAPT